MKMWRVLTMTIVFVWIGMPVLDRLLTWLAPAVWAGVVALAPPAAAALALVVYFHWRARLKSRLVEEAPRDQAMAAAA